MPSSRTFAEASTISAPTYLLLPALPTPSPNSPSPCNTCPRGLVHRVQVSANATVPAAVAQFLGRLPRGGRPSGSRRAALLCRRAAGGILRHDRPPTRQHRDRPRLPPRADGEVPSGPRDLDAAGLAHGRHRRLRVPVRRARPPQSPQGRPGQRKRTLEPDPVRAAVVKHIYDLYLSGGVDITQIRDALNVDPDRYPPPIPVDPARALGAWSRSSIWEVLRNPKYTG